MQVKETVKEISSPEEMFQYGVEMARLHGTAPLILALKGDLGAGKTTFLKGFISELASVDPSEIQSPTFTYLQTYGDTISHFDLYRLQHHEQFESAGFGDILHQGGICCIEWPERIESHLPAHTLFLQISYLSPHLRQCSLYQKEPA
jgi:tRNA threonylcarbamoyladenosine biosynthesis protein TsaE